MSQNFLLDFAQLWSYISSRLFSLSFDQSRNYREKHDRANETSFQNSTLVRDRMNFLIATIQFHVTNAQAISYSS